MRYSKTTIPAGDAGTWATLRKMRQLARHAATDPIVRKTAVGLVTGVPGSQLQARILADWIGAHVSFVRDPATAEALHTVPFMLRTIAERGILGVDCDDVATLAAALGLSVGLSARFVVLAFNSPHFSHVFTALGPGNFPVDPTRPAQGFDLLPISRSAAFEV